MITIIDYGLGNLGSVKNALDKLGVNSTISSKMSDIENADGLILPGVGAAGEGMKNLREKKLDKSIRQVVQNGKPLLGICLGMQLLMSSSEEGDVSCLNIVNGKVKKFIATLKVPQIGWNSVQAKEGCPLFKGIPKMSFYYFVHSYYCAPILATDVEAQTQYGETFCSALRRKNVFGVQFHPEKSGENGLRLLKNYANYIYENNTSYRSTR